MSDHINKMSSLNISYKLPIPDPSKKMEIISTLSVLFLSETSEMCNDAL